MNWLFRIFVGVGLLIVIALFSALLAPYFINWERFTGEFETQASRIVGQPVKVGGQSNLRLLPLPYISFEDLEVGRNADGSPLMTVEQFSLNAELFPFLSGEVRIVEMAMLRPKVNLQVAENGTIAWTSPQELPVDPEQVNIENLAISGGSILIDGLAGGREISFENINGAIAARSVLGPWRIDVNSDVNGVASTFKISTGTFQQSERSIRLKIEASKEDQPYKALLDGPIRLQDDVLNWSGDFSVTPYTASQDSKKISSAQPLPVRTEGLFLATPQRIEVPEFRMEVGSVEDPYTIIGTGRAEIKETVFFRVEADGRQIDLDRIKQLQDNTATATFESRLAVLRSILERIPVPEAEGEVDVILPAIVAGDTYVREVKAKVRPFGKSWDLRSFSAIFPGNTLVEAQGRLGLHENFGFAGKVLIASRQPSGLAAWMSGGVDAQIRRLKTLGFVSEATITTKQATFENLELRMDDAVLSGKLQRLAPGNGRAALVAELQGNLINIQDLQGLYSLTRDPSESELASHDLDIKIKAGQLEAELWEKSVTAAEVDAHVRVREGSVSVERLNAGNFYGAELKSSGRLADVLESPDGNFKLDVVAKNAIELIQFAQDFAGEHPLLKALLADSSLTQGTNLHLELNARSSDNGSKGQLLVLGKSGGTDINSRLAFEGDLSTPEAVRIDSQNSFSNDTVSILAQQFGIDTLPPELSGEVPGPAKLNLGLNGKVSDGFGAEVRFSAPGTNVSANGHANFPAADKVEGYLDVTLGSENLAPYFLVTGVPIPDLATDSKLPASLTFKAEKKHPSVKIQNLNGQIAGNKLTAELDYQFAEVQRPRLSGKIELSEFSVPLVAQSVFGFTDLLGINAVGLEGKREFSISGFSGYDAKLSITANSIDTGIGISGTSASSEFVMLDGALDLNDVSFETLGGAFDGNLGLKNTAGTVLGTLRFSLKDVGLEQLLNVSGIPQVATGSVSINGSAESSGRSQQGMLSNLSGNGVVTIRGANLKGLNPEAFSDILLTSDIEGFEITPERVSSMVDETIFNSGISVPIIDAPYSVTRGKIKIRNLVHETDQAEIKSGIEISIPTAELEAETSIAFKPDRREAISGADPLVRVSWNGPFASLQRTTDVSQLEGYLSLRAFETSQRRVETLEARVIEKQRIQREIAFNFAREEYRLRKAEEARLALEEEKRQLEEAERLRLEEEARRLEEERLKAEEEARRIEEEKRRAEEEAWLLEKEQREKEAEEQAKREAEERAKREAEEQARLEEERQAAAQSAAESIDGTFTSEPLPPPEPSIAPSLRENIIQNIENFLSGD